MLTKHEMPWLNPAPMYGTRPLSQYRISGLPPGEHALISEFADHCWRILRWNDEWHGNWTGHYSSLDDAVNALRAQVSAVA
jgi:hypothetical protein